MSPSAEINQQPQAQEMTADQTAQQVVTSQPTANNTMEANPEVSMRGGGMVGDCFEAICAFECCKGLCDCCC
ncbi:hypothetical protein NA56DRAFT_651072 [Hyaloscypha hepaticicola]|uniref:Uncharacterized protein n=1 Tax=Hyaloscypha hepaticicola TaxID=2082293 RepID=A0A2J6PKB9_9HELO|nr:hypothetical protein NA56DRAFT_651072 [Hyaloscypha hepaticicola]